MFYAFFVFDIKRNAGRDSAANYHGDSDPQSRKPAVFSGKFFDFNAFRIGFLRYTAFFCVF